MNRSIIKSALTVAAMTGLILNVAAKEVPVELPDPDGQPGSADKPVKVYILAGQSNMVGMGDVSGAKNPYTGIYFSSDPGVPDKALTIYRVGTYRIGRLSVYKPDGTETDKAIAEGQIEVPQMGVYQIHCGFEKNSFNRMLLDGKEVYRREVGGEPVMQDSPLKPGKRYAFKITGFKGEPPRFWMQKTDLLGYGDLESVAKREGKFPWLVDDKGEWTVRNDVYFQEARLAEGGRGSPLSATSNGKSIGPELGFGHILGAFHDEQVLLIKTAQGNRSLGFDFRPPSSGRSDPDSKFESIEYKLMVEGVRKTLDKIKDIVPGYKGQGYEIAGFVWWQGHKDKGLSQEDYEKHLVNLINDLRKEFDVPKMPAVVATVGFHGHNMIEEYVKILQAQMAVGDPGKHPEFAGTVASVDTRDFWREVNDSPRNQDYHYNRNAETYMLVGDALGRAMVRLLGGQAVDFPLVAKHPPAPKKEGAGEEVLSEAELEAEREALKPAILDGIAKSYIDNPRYSKLLLAEAVGEKPQRANQFLQGAMYALLNCYRAVGIHDYDWKPFGLELTEERWDYFCFDPPEKQPQDDGKPRYRKVTLPEGMDNWFAPDFDAGKAGWKDGLPPFGQLKGEMVPLGSCTDESLCRCGVPPKTLWDKEVVLMRKTIDVPRLKEGHRYRIVIGGSNHVNAGEGFALYVDGELIEESNRGVGMRQGAQPRGGHVYKEFLPLFADGKATIAVMSFLRYKHPRTEVYPRGHISLWMEEQKLPPLD